MDLQTNLVLTCITITASTLLYTGIWLRPAKFSDWVCAGLRPVRVMALLAHTLKLLQFTLIAVQVNFALTGSGEKGAPRDKLISELYSGDFRTHARLAGCLALFVFGQTLNARVYLLLGEGGVYYGNKLEPDVKRPWVTAWPYSSQWLRHPQYLGSSLTLLGFYGARLIHAVPALCWAVNYAFLALLESDLLFSSATAPSGGQAAAAAKKKGP
jgi:hypothetical protein